VIVHFADLEFTAVAELGETGLFVSFRVLDVHGLTDMGKPLYEPTIDAPDNLEGYIDTTDPLHAKPYLHGSVKWDGCSDWHFDEQDEGMLHGCSRENVQRFGDVLGRCWDLAGEIMGYRWRPC
jgi:hypothetical protein